VSGFSVSLESLHCVNRHRITQNTCYGTDGRTDGWPDGQHKKHDAIHLLLSAEA